MFPAIAKAQVMSQAAPDGVRVMLASGQIPGYPVKVGIDGPADALRIKREALPTPGTWGLVAFPAGDERNGVWLKAYYAQQVTADSLTNDPHAEYDSHYSGRYRSLDQYGNENIYFPDGTSIIISASGELAPTYRQTVNPQQVQESTEFTPAQRIPNPPSSYHYCINHSSGAYIRIMPDGTINVNAAEGKKVNFSQDGATVDNSLALVSTLVAWLLSHTHTSESAGTPTSVPNQSLTAAEISSTVVEVSG